jgi:hypothetical protein
MKGENIMSGGTFDNQQWVIYDIAETIQHIIDNNEHPDNYGFCTNFNTETLEEFKTAVEILKKAYIYARRIDWLVAGDDGEESFHKRLKSELADGI